MGFDLAGLFGRNKGKEDDAGDADSAVDDQQAGKPSFLSGLLQRRQGSKDKGKAAKTDSRSSSLPKPSVSLDTLDKALLVVGVLGLFAIAAFVVLRMMAIGLI